jgi:Na+/glutamate symporter
MLERKGDRNTQVSRLILINRSDLGALKKVDLSSYFLVLCLLSTAAWKLFQVALPLVISLAPQCWRLMAISQHLYPAASHFSKLPGYSLKIAFMSLI